MEQLTEQELNFLRQAIDLARQARHDGRHPFGALIVNERGETVVAARNNAVRPAGWTSADAAGLPIFPGLARYDEVARGTIDHALRFTVARTRRAYVYPARHFASSSKRSKIRMIARWLRRAAA